MNQFCSHKSKVVHERGKRFQTQMACYIYFSGKGQMVAMSNDIGVWWLNKFGCLVVKQVRMFISDPILLALARMSSVFCFLLLPVVYFVVEIAYMC
jgi:hypothetical protein